MRMISKIKGKSLKEHSKQNYNIKHLHLQISKYLISRWNKCVHSEMVWLKEVQSK